MMDTVGIGRDQQTKIVKKGAYLDDRDRGGNVRGQGSGQWADDGGD
jgi:hypothetical protein